MGIAGKSTGGLNGVTADAGAPLLPGQHWRSAAACRSVDPDLFFPISNTGKSLEQVAEAKAICAGCEVRRQCLAFALRTRQAHGIWGGLTEQERYPTAQARERGSYAADGLLYVPAGRLRVQAGRHETLAAIAGGLPRAPAARTAMLLTDRRSGQRAESCGGEQVGIVAGT